MSDPFTAAEPSNAAAGRPLTARDGDAYLRHLVTLAVAERVSDPVSYTHLTLPTNSRV